MLQMTGMDPATLSKVNVHTVTKSKARSQLEREAPVREGGEPVRIAAGFSTQSSKARRAQSRVSQVLERRQLRKQLISIFLELFSDTGKEHFQTHSLKLALP